MRLYFLKDHDGYKAGEDKFVELTLGRRFCENGIAIPYVTHLEHVEAEKREEAERKAAEVEAKKAEAEEKKKAVAEKKRTAVSKKATGRSKATM